MMLDEIRTGLHVTEDFIGNLRQRRELHIAELVEVRRYALYVPAFDLTRFSIVRHG